MHAAPTLVRYHDLDQLGVTRYRFDRMVADGEYERIAPGVFVRDGAADDTTATWMAVAIKKPAATICLLSSLAMHDLTDEIPARSDIALPRGMRPVSLDLAPVAWHRFDPQTFALGRTEHALPGGLAIGLYSPERTIVDLFRLRHDWGADLAVDALKRWLRRRPSSPSTLLDLASRFPMALPSLRHTLEVLL